MADIDHRYFIARGRRIRATVAPREKRDGFGLDDRLRTIIFELDGEWLGSAPILADYRLSLLTAEEMRHYLAQARAADGRRR